MFFSGENTIYITLVFCLYENVLITHSDKKTCLTKNVVFQQNLNIGEKLPFSQTVMMIS